MNPAKNIYTYQGTLNSILGTLMKQTLAPGMASQLSLQVGHTPTEFGTAQMPTFNDCCKEL